MPKYDINLRDYWRTIRKRRTIVILATILFTAFSCLFAFISNPEPRYEATSAVKVERVTDLTSLLLGTVYWSIRDNVATQAVIITSFPVMEQAAREMGLIPAAVSTAEVHKSEKYVRIVNSLRSRVTTELQENTNIINIKATAPTPADAALLANTVAEVFRQANMEDRNKKIRETREFIEKQLEVVQSRLQEAEDNLRKFEESTKLVAIDAQTAAVVSRLTTMESEVARLQQRRAEAQRQLEFLEQHRTGAQVGREGFYMENPPPQFGRLSGKLADLTLRRSVLLNDYTPEHPEVKEVSVEIRNVLSEMDKELRSVLSSTDRQIQDVESRLATARAQAMAIPESALALARLRREVDVNVQLYSQLKSKYQEALIQESGLIEEVKVVKPALEPTAAKDSRNVPINTATGAVIGLVVGLVLALVVETMDTSLATIEEIEEVLHIPVLGVIPSADAILHRDKSKEETKLLNDCLVTHFMPRSPVAEAYRSLRTNFQFIRKGKKAKVFLITSSTLQEGKTYNVVNLSLSLAQTGERVLLVDADLRRPIIHRIFGVEKRPGLAEYILGDYDGGFWGGAESLPPAGDLLDPDSGMGTWKKVVNDITSVMLGEFEIDELLRTPGADNLHIITAGAAPVNPGEIFRSSRFKEFLGQVRDAYDIVIIDTPPVLPVADAYEVAPQVDGVVLVYEAGRIGRGILRRAKVQLENVNASVLGVILNNVKPEVAPDLYRYRTEYYKSESDRESKSARPAGWRQVLAGLMSGTGAKLRRPAFAGGNGRGKRLLLLSLGAVFALVVGWQIYPTLHSSYQHLSSPATKSTVAATKVKAAKTPVVNPQKETQQVPAPSAKSKSPGKYFTKAILPPSERHSVSPQVLTAEPSDTKPASGSENPAVEPTTVEPAAALAAKTPSPDRPLPAEGESNPVPPPAVAAQQSLTMPVSGTRPEHPAVEPTSAGHGTVQAAHGPSSERPFPPHRESVPVQPQLVTAQQGDATPPSSSGAPRENSQERAAEPATVPTETATPPGKPSAGVEPQDIATKQPIPPEHRIVSPTATIEAPKHPSEGSIPPFREWEPISLKETDARQGGVEAPQASSVSSQNSPHPATEPPGAPTVSDTVVRTAKGTARVKATVPAQTRGQGLYRTTPQLAIIRSEPDVNAPVLQQVALGTELHVVTREGDWLKLRLRSGELGWIHQRLAEKAAPVQSSSVRIYLTVPQLARIRVEPDLNAPVLQQVPEGTELRAIARDGDWLKLELRDGDIGWIHQGLVKESG
jgi:capsular exopolysaccharide synthesis family protein